MPVHTFSTKSSRPVDTDAINRVKQHCEANCLNFSAIVVNLIKEWEANHVSKVQSAQSSTK